MDRNRSVVLTGGYHHTVTIALVLMTFVLVLQTEQVSCNINCIRRTCDQENSVIFCNQSVILISDVTNTRLERDHVALRAMTKACMGRGSCDPSKVCSKGHHKTLFVHYFCEDAKNIFSTCSDEVFEIQGNHGVIQSPYYPVSLPKFMPCRWRIRSPNDSLVVLTLHDVTTNGPGEKCDGGLMVSGLECDVLIDHAPRLLCGGDNVTSVVRCGKVDIELSQSDRVYPIRFWLSFHVHPKYQRSSFTSSVLTCSGWVYSMNGATTQKQLPMVSKESDTQLLIILLTVISIILATLLVVLVIVCIRCRLMRMTVSDHVYSEPSPALQAHYDYISSLERDKVDPELVDGYFEVADALPYGLGDTPASPAYAEVEQFIDFKKGKWSSVDSTEWADCQSGDSNGRIHEMATLKTENDDSKHKHSSLGTNKNVEDRIKIHKFRRSPKQNKCLVKISKNPEPKVFIVNLESAKQDNNADHDDSSTYEQIEIQTNGETNKIVLSDSNPLSKPQQFNKRDTIKNQVRMKGAISNEKLKPTNQLHQSRVDQIKEGLLSKQMDQKEDVLNKKEMGGTKSDTALRKGNHSPVISNKRVIKLGESSVNKSDTVECPDESNSKQQRSSLLKERLQTSGIVRNGIQKFEQQ